MTKILNRQGLKAEVVPRASHTISRNEISKSALKVLYRLHKGGYQAFLVGGSVRDILLGKHPKDFDVATDATPEQVRRLFSNSMIIGRRFRLVHVRYGHDIVEVATFRGEHTEESGKLHEKTGMILRDNVYGELEEDVLRRDFTVNALYYNIADFSIVDYVQGMKDLKARTIRVLGDPDHRYKEDPVRMLRAIRFAAKLQFTIELQSAEAITKNKDLLENVSSARLFDEIIKMSLCGHVEKIYELLNEFTIFEKLFPLTYASIKNDETEMSARFMQIALKETDERIATGKTINPAFLMAVFYWVPLQERVKFYLERGEKLYPATALAESEVLKQLHPLIIPKRLIAIVRDIWRMQYHLAQTRRNRIFRSFYHPRFRAAYDFMLIRNKSGEDLDSLCEFWTEFQDANQDDQDRLINQYQLGSNTTRGRQFRRKKQVKRDG